MMRYGLKMGKFLLMKGKVADVLYVCSFCFADCKQE